MLKGITGKSTGASAEPLVIDQKGCEYTPYIAAVQTGQKIIAKNSDPVLHNIHPTPVVAGNKEENKAQMPGGGDLNFVFPSAENFLKFKCDVHPWMFAYITVVDSPYFAVSGKDGTFKRLVHRGFSICWRERQGIAEPGRPPAPPLTWSRRR